MTIFNENWQIIESPNLELGRLEDRQKSVVYEWVVDAEAQTHEEVIAEYPETGGKEVMIVTDVPEQGHWEVTDENGDQLEGFDEEIPEWLPKEEISTGVWNYQVYIPYTQEELDAFEQAKLEAEERQRKFEAEREFIENGADIQAAQDEAICELYEMILGLE